MSKRKAFSKPDLPLTPPIFYILLALGKTERHGYDIMKQVRQDSFGKIVLGPGTLYNAIRRMVEAGLIEEAAERPDLEKEDERRKYYQLTEKGRSLLVGELQRFSEALQVAEKTNLFPGLPVLVHR